MLDWLWGFVGGLMIGGAAALYLLLNGRVMGASGIIGGLADRSGWGNWAERLVFLAGLIGVPSLLSLLIGDKTHLTSNWLVMFSGMTNTRRVQRWLDVFGAWDPTLAVVLGGAILPMAVAVWSFYWRCSAVWSRHPPCARVLKAPPQLPVRGAKWISAP